MFARIKRIIWKTGTLTMLLSLLGVTFALAEPGDLDPSFGGGDGLQVTNFNIGSVDTLRALARQPDGKILAVGDTYAFTDGTAKAFGLARYNADGSPDTTFGFDGKAYYTISHLMVGGPAQGFRAVVQPDGKIVVAGRWCINFGDTDCKLALLRIESDGKSPDMGFNGGDPLVVDFGGADAGTYGGLAVQSSGKIVVAGYRWNGTDYDFTVHRFYSDGSPDTTFSGDGRAQVGFGSGRQDYAYDLAIRNGKIVVVGESCDSAGHNCNFALARLTSSGKRDTTFSADGKQTTNMGGSDTAHAVAIQSDGRIVVVGQRDNGTAATMAIARYMPGGALDTTFSGDGKLTISFGGNAGARDVLMHGNKIVVAGWADPGTGWDFAMARLRANGGRDTSFSNDGKLLVDFGATEWATGLITQPLDDNKYVLGGSTDTGLVRDFALARILP